MCLMSQLAFVDSSNLHKVSQQAGLERVISMYGHRDSSRVTLLRVNVVTSLRSSQFPAVLLMQFRELFP